MFIPQIFSKLKINTAAAAKTEIVAAVKMAVTDFDLLVTASFRAAADWAATQGSAKCLEGILAMADYDSGTLSNDAPMTLQ